MCNKVYGNVKETRWGKLWSGKCLVERRGRGRSTRVRREAFADVLMNVSSTFRRTVPLLFPFSFFMTKAKSLKCPPSLPPHLWEQIGHIRKVKNISNSFLLRIPEEREERKNKARTSAVTVVSLTHRLLIPNWQHPINTCKLALSY